MSDADDIRTNLRDALQTASPWDDDEGKVVVGFVFIAEWVDANGLRWLTTNSGNADGAQLPTWQTNGYLHEAMYGDWPSVELDDDED